MSQARRGRCRLVRTPRQGGVRVVTVLLLALAVLTGSSCTRASDRDAVATTSSDAAGSSAQALVDALRASPADSRALGEQWSAASGQQSAWAQLSWPEPQRLSAVQLFGPAEEAIDPTQSTAAALHGWLRFSDGSTVKVSGVSDGGELPTTVAFPPREAAWVRVELERQVPEAVLGLRELRAFTADELPPRVPGDAETYAVQPPAAEECDPSAPGAPATAGSVDGVSLVCPAVGATVSGPVDVVIDAPPGTELVASAMAVPSGQEGGDRLVLREVARATASAQGRAVLRVDPSILQHGPTALSVAAGAGDDARPRLHVQLLNSAGVVLPDSSDEPRADGRTLVYEDQFDQPLSVSASGEGAAYAATKPEPWGGSQFGDAVFADPAWGADTLGTVMVGEGSAANGFLRVRAEPIGDLADRATWEQRHVAGIVSSQRFGGAGFSAQYGYFEARMLGAPGPGAWSAFWAMNSEQGTGRQGGRAGELDVAELYGHDTAGSCHTVHSWGTEGDLEGDKVCTEAVRPADWAASWHVYSAQVTPGGAVIAVDGVEVARFSGLSHTDEPYFFMLDLALGGGWPVDLSATQNTVDLYVDWVRVWT